MAAPRGRPIPGLPSPAVHRAIDEQNTPALRKEAKRYAEQRIPMLRLAGYPVSKRCADELVHDAITATWLGEGDAWDPSECSLLVHVRGLIKSRAWQEVRRRLRSPHVPLGPAVEDDIERALTQTHASVGDISPILLASLVATICAELRRIGPDDKHAHVILECWENGFAERREVMLLTGLVEDAYRRARDRILCRKQYLPAKLCALAEDLFDRSAS